ncbi:hypothetical protein JVT61DRAFT_14909 [Boletus reticuloceps]|uniref:DEAD/DEAH box helicase domain-containing protein n=1 Tax=Boletus reticuloceps TaxID=495285 RepID=A0A8I2YCI9_9AGAM|nr:hypothetical protein JVT61DRAFT_14909 [Boletus reticuloceps]
MSAARTLLHVEQVKKSYNNLDRARKLARKSSDYSTHTTRHVLTTACLEKCHNRIPYAWQLDSAEAFFLGLDCTVIAGTGSGKSLPFVMPSMICPEKILIVISPLNSLEADQVSLIY